MTSSDIHELKEVVKTGFERVDGQFEGLRGEIGEFRSEHREFQSHVAKHFGRVYERLGSMYERLGSMGERQDGMNDRLRRVEVGQEEMAHDFKAALEQVSDTNRRVDALESKMERGFSDLREEMRFGFQAWGKRVEAVEARLEQDGSSP